MASSSKVKPLIIVSTKDPIQKAVRDSLIAFMAATAQAQAAEATKDAQRAGIAHATENDATAYRGRKPSFSRDQLNSVMCLKGTTNASQIAKDDGIAAQWLASLRTLPQRKRC